MDENISFGIVIVTYNRLDLLKECIKNAVGQSWDRVSLYIVNNASTDGTDRFLDELGRDDKAIHIKNLSSNTGGAGGFYHGLSFAYEDGKSDYFLLIDDDAMLDKDYIRNIAEHISGKDSAYSVTVRVNERRDISHRLSRINRRIPVEEYRRPVFECGIATFCGMVLSRKLVGKIGFPRKEFFIWNDDTEYCIRIGKHSKILNVSASFIEHKTGEKSEENDDSVKSWKKYYGIRNIVWIEKRYGFRLLLIKQIALSLGKALILYVRSYASNPEAYRYNACVRFDAVRDGLRGKLGRNRKYLPRTES